MDIMEFSKDIYNYEMIKQYFINDNNIYFVAGYMILNGKVYQKTCFNICYNLTCNVSLTDFKKDMNKKLKDNNYKMQKLNIQNKNASELFNYDNIPSQYLK